MAFDDEGTIRPRRSTIVEDDGAYPTPWPVGVTFSVGGLFPGPYRVPKSSFTTKSIYTNTPGRTAYRGPWVFESVAREMLLDMAARQMGMDPVELRRRNLLREQDMPYTNPNGMPFDFITPLENFDQAIEALDYEAFRRQQAAAREVGRYLGVGTCSYVEPTTPSFGMFATEGATIRIEPSGKVNVYIAGGSTGNSLETTVVQLTADALGVDMEDVATIQGDTAVDRVRGRDGRQPQRVDDRRGRRRDRPGAARSHRGHRRAPPRSRRPRTSSSPTAGRACAARPRPTSRSPRSPRSPTSSPTHCLPASRPGWRPPAATRR